jgi:hypothetical protein
MQLPFTREQFLDLFAACNGRRGRSIRAVSYEYDD